MRKFLDGDDDDDDDDDGGVPHVVKRNRQERSRRIAETMFHSNVCTKFHAIRHKSERHIFHEDPQSASSWEELGMMVLAGVEGVIRTKAHICRHGVTQISDDVPKPPRNRLDFPQLV